MTKTSLYDMTGSARSYTISQLSDNTADVELFQMIVVWTGLKSHYEMMQAC